jgi:hypothetical protein
MLKYIEDGEHAALKSPEKLYVAVTRARFSAAFVVPKFLPPAQLSLFSGSGNSPRLIRS